MNFDNVKVTSGTNTPGIHHVRPSARFVSSVFHPSITVDSLLPDLTILSSDSVLFFVHKHRLRQVHDLTLTITGNPVSASNSYHTGSPTLAPVVAGRDRKLLPCIAVPENAQVFSVVLHATYGFREIRFICPPSFDDLCDAVKALRQNGLTPMDQYVYPNTTVFQLLVDHASGSLSNSRKLARSNGTMDSEQNRNNIALRVYTLAARNGLHELAVAVSGQLLSFPLNSLSDEEAEQIGAVYLKRLFCLHLRRLSSLKALLLPPPCKLSQWFARTSSTKHTCDVDQFDKITRSWALAVSDIMLNGRPDLDVHTLDNILRPLGDDIECASCRRMWAERVYEVVTDYSNMKRTI